MTDSELYLFSLHPPLSSYPRKRVSSHPPLMTLYTLDSCLRRNDEIRIITISTTPTFSVIPAKAGIQSFTAHGFEYADFQSNKTRQHLHTSATNVTGFARFDSMLLCRTQYLNRKTYTLQNLDLANSGMILCWQGESQDCCCDCPGYCCCDS